MMPGMLLLVKVHAFAALTGLILMVWSVRVGRWFGTVVCGLVAMVSMTFLVGAVSGRLPVWAAAVSAVVQGTLAVALGCWTWWTRRARG
jgi:hypothetical protein